MLRSVSWTVPTIVTAHTFCASRDLTRVSYGVVPTNTGISLRGLNAACFFLGGGRDQFGQCSDISPNFPELSHSKKLSKSAKIVNCVARFRQPVFRLVRWFSRLCFVRSDVCFILSTSLGYSHKRLSRCFWPGCHATFTYSMPCLVALNAICTGQARA